MSFFPIPADKWGTKEKKKVQLTNETKKIIREARQSRSHTIKSVKKNSKKMDEQANIRINDIKNIINKYQDTYWWINNINLLAAKCVQERIFENSYSAKIFIVSFKEKIFN
jgi:hypothetical protein